MLDIPTNYWKKRPYTKHALGKKAFLWGEFPDFDIDIIDTQSFEVFQNGIRCLFKACINQM